MLLLLDYSLLLLSTLLVWWPLPFSSVMLLDKLRCDLLLVFVLFAATFGAPFPPNPPRRPLQTVSSPPERVETFHDLVQGLAPSLYSSGLARSHPRSDAVNIHRQYNPSASSYLYFPLAPAAHWSDGHEAQVQEHNSQFHHHPIFASENEEALLMNSDMHGLSVHTANNASNSPSEGQIAYKRRKTKKYPPELIAFGERVIKLRGTKYASAVSRRTNMLALLRNLSEEQRERIMISDDAEVNLIAAEFVRVSLLTSTSRKGRLI
jgi:hypothetical protein